MRVLDLFSGIGGFSLGLERAGMTTVAFCEIEPFARAVLAKHWPKVPIYDDVRKLTADRLVSDGVGKIDLICAGYPCQPFSHAGKRLGAKDDRYLWPEVRRIVGEVRPTWVVSENVAGHISMGLDQVLSDLEGLGYAARAIVVPACAVDATHIRRRVWIVARDPDRDRESACTVDAKAQGVPGDIGESDGSGSRWTAEPGVCRVAHGIPRQVDRLRGLGNSVVPRVVEVIGRAIMAESRAVR
jgi:DNA (cytosine-5)-methyltransferase 1